MTDQPNTPRPELPCACCGATMDAIWQKPLLAWLPGYWLVTCVTPDCGMHGQTLAAHDYPPEDMFKRYGIRNPVEVIDS